MLYQRKQLSTGANVGNPAPLPADLVGGLSDEDLARLGDIVSPEAREEYGDAAFVPVGEPPPPAVRVISVADFLERFSQAERISIRAAGKNDAILEDWLDLLYHASEIDLDSQYVTQGLAYAVAQTFLTPERSTAIRA